MSEVELLPTAEETVPENYQSGFVAIFGRPNVGKSTLMNSLLEQKIAIVSPRPQTTRTRQLGILTTDQYQLIFIDMPGIIQKARHSLDQAMLASIKESVEGVDLILWLVDLSIPPNAGDQEIAELLKPLQATTKIVIGMNKIDLVKIEEVEKLLAAYQALLPDSPSVIFSAETKAGLDDLKAMLISSVPQGPRFYPEDQVTESFVRTIAAEMVREQLLIQIADEVPHAVAVVVDEFKERENGVIYIHATIYVERESHKKIIIGTNGAKIRQIGVAAREQIEPLVEASIFLDLHIKVSPNWRSNHQLVEQFGYTLPTG